MPTTRLSTEPTAVLVLEDGRRFSGQAYGARGRTLGEIVFATGMTGYQETLTDPSYAGQIVVQTAPHIGNTGMNDEDEESRRIWVAGYVVRDPSRVVSNFRAQRSLGDDLETDGIVGISGVDTRAITRHIRSLGSMRSGVFSGEDLALPEEEQLALVLGGALGNIVDRVRFGYVVDFADVHIGSFRPFLIFNVADAAITIGVLVLLIRALLLRDPPKEPEATETL